MKLIIIIINIYELPLFFGAATANALKNMPDFEKVEICSLTIFNILKVVTFATKLKNSKMYKHRK